jgi:molybdopterin/thiamine biosynthesis adenylyltransferase
MNAKESEIYDRQIRLWGVDSQRRLQDARVLIAGVTALGAEVAKNVVLAGLSVTLMDTAILGSHEVHANFLANKAAVGSNVRVCKFRVRCHVACV